MKYRGLVLILMFACQTLLAQSKKVNYEAEISANVSTESNLPFWMETNKYGIVPDDNSGLIRYKVFTNLDSTKKINFDFGASMVGSRADKTEFLVSELYGSVNWKFIEAYAGVKNREVQYDGLSVINGDLLFTNNARSYPEIRIGSNDFVTIKPLKNIISFKATFANGIMLDKRYVNNANVHHKNFYIKLGEYKGFSVIAGMDHYVQWGGKSPVWGEMGGFDAFVDAVFIRNGDVLVDENGNTSVTESMNKRGNHIGQHSLEINYSNEKMLVSAYLKSLFEDSSGYGHNLQYVHDWNFGIYVKIKKGGVISSFMYEHFYSRHQSDELIRPEYTQEPVIGYDNYFNNGVYKSGWTSYGRTIGNPLFTPMAEGDGITLGIYNNAVKAHHFALKGTIAGVTYTAKATFSKNYGRPFLTNDGGGVNPENYHRTYTIDPAAKQQSYSLELRFPKFEKLPFDINLGFAYDNGDHLKDNNLGCYISLIKKGIF